MIILQRPNPPLIVALVASLLGMFIHGLIHGFLAALAYMAWSAWAYLEVSQGVNWFRRALGAVTLAVVFARMGMILPQK